jgi:hypothetical protein
MTDLSLLFINCIDDDGELTLKPKARICLLDRLSSVTAITYDDGVNATQDVTTDVPVLYFSDRTKPYSLDFEFLIENFYGTLTRVLADFKMISCKLMLTALDIAQLNHFIPVYVQKFGNYFYLNKVSNFIQGLSTKCDLIRL